MDKRNQLFVFQEPNWEHINTCFQMEYDTYIGYVYALEYGDYVKIGSTTNPANRYRILNHNARDYGDIQTGKFAVSLPCTNYRELEKEMQKKFASYRKDNTELFDIEFDAIIDALILLNYQREEDALRKKQRILRI